MSNYEFNELYKHEDEHLHLGRLLTDLGEKSLYDAVAQCNRCGYCETVCPTYMITGRETISPRGRNQFLRLLIEGKVKGTANAQESFSTCLLCGACSTTCYAKVATPDLVLEGRRSLNGYGSGLAARLGVDMLLHSRGFFELLLKAGYLMKRLGFAGLARAFGLYSFIGMPALGEAEASLKKVPLKFLRDIFRRDPELGTDGKKEIKWSYFAACGSNYLFTEVGIATVALLKRFLGTGVFSDNHCCGLLAYNYGRITEAMAFAKKNILRYEELKASLGEFTIVGDCASCVAFLKSYEQLFIGDELWRPRAKEFAAAVKDILETLPVDAITAPNNEIAPEKVTYHDSCRACHGQGIRKEPREALKKIAGANFVELPESDWCCGGAGAYAFTQEALSDKILERKIKNIVSVQPRTVLAGATSCLLQLGAGLKYKYPSAGVKHYSVYMEEHTRPQTETKEQ